MITAVDAWTTKRLGEIGKSLIGLTYDPASVKPTGTLVLRSSNVQDGLLSLQDNVYVDCTIPERIRVRDRDILICVRNGSRRLIGKSVMLDHRVVGQTFGAFMAVYRSDLNGYLKYFFQSDDFKRQIDGHLGATINQITNSSLNGFLVLIPPGPEQAVISSRLDDIEQLIATIDRMIAKKQAIKQGMMQELVTGRIRLPGYAGSWRHLTAGQVGTFKGGSGFPLRHQGAPTGTYPFYKVSDMNTPGNEQFMKRANNYISESQRKQMAARLMPREAIVFAKVGAAIFQERRRILTQTSCIDNNLAAFILDPSQFDVKFAYYALSHFEMSSLVSTTAMPSLNGAQLRSIPLAMPPSLGEQQAVACVLEDADADLQRLQDRLVKAREIKQGMVQQLLTGRVRLPIPRVAA